MQINVRQLMSLATAITAVFLCLNNSASAQLFDMTYSQPLTEQEVCDTIVQKPQALEEMQGNIQRNIDTAANNDYLDYRISGGVYYENGWCWVRANQNAFKRQRSKDYDGNWTQWRETPYNFSSTKNGTVKTEPSCDINGEFSYQANDRCWNPEDLAERDSCPDDGSLPSLPDTLGVSSNVCSVQPDGSKCAYSKSENGNSFEYNPNLSCYEDNYQEYEHPNTTPPEPNQCQTITSGNTTSTFCPAEESAVCPNGLCHPSCGSFDIGYGEVFGCFSPENDNICDQDNDGQIDDVCLTPPPSCDVDPNQSHCPTSPEPVNCSENPEHEYCQNPPPNCQENPTQEGCGTTEPPTTEPPTDTIEGLQQIRGEQQKTNELLSGVTSGIDGVKTEVKGVKTSVDKLTEEQEKTTEATKEVGVAIVGLKNTLNNTGGVSMVIAPSDGLAGWYESKYPDGFSTVMETVTPLYQSSTMNEYLDSWKVSVSGNYEFPEVCVDVGVANFGCHSLSVDPRVLPFIRIILIISALMLARSLVFGG
jgi:hypothetical protein